MIRQGLIAHVADLEMRIENDTVAFHLVMCIRDTLIVVDAPSKLFDRN